MKFDWKEMWKVAKNELKIDWTIKSFFTSPEKLAFLVLGFFLLLIYLTVFF